MKTQKIIFMVPANSETPQVEKTNITLARLSRENNYMVLPWLIVRSWGKLNRLSSCIVPHTSIACFTIGHILSFYSPKEKLVTQNPTWVPTWVETNVHSAECSQAMPSLVVINPITMYRSWEPMHCRWQADRSGALQAFFIQSKIYCFS